MVTARAVSIKPGLAGSAVGFDVPAHTVELLVKALLIPLYLPGS